MRRVVPRHTRERGHETCQRVHVFGIDGIALKRHSAGANLLLTERLMPLPEGWRLEQPEVCRKLVERLRQRRESAEHAVLLLPRCGLSRHEKRRKVEALHDLRLERRRVPVGTCNQLGVGGARPYRTLKALATDLVVQPNEVRHVHGDVLAILSEPVANRRRFGWLEVGERHGRRVRPRVDLVGERAHELVQLATHNAQTVSQAQRIGIVLHVHGGGSEVNDAARRRALLGIGMHFGHQVVVKLGLTTMRLGNVDVVLMGAKLFDLCRCHESDVRLGICKRDPNPTPEAALARLAKRSTHLG